MVGRLIFAAGLAVFMPHFAAANSVSQSLTDKAEKEITQKAYQNAIKFCEQAIVADPADASAFACLGQGYMKTGDKKTAQRYYKIALDILPTHQRALAWSGEADIANNRPDKARQKLRRLQRVCGECDAYQQLRTSLLRYESKKSAKKKQNTP